jgi:anti-anti-sigma factor
MTTTNSSPSEPAALVSLAMTEIVRGQEQELFAHITPLLGHQSIALDLASVTRIDAAGIAALLSLYVSADHSGHRFRVANPSPRIAEILTLVGLERILESHIANNKSYCGSCYQRPAA